ncbi:MAG: hypothetical protein AAF599_01440 [Bacteroidota bacterium]
MTEVRSQKDKCKNRNGRMPLVRSTIPCLGKLIANSQWLIAFSLFFLPSISQAQSTPKLNEGNGILLNFSYGYQLPFEDMEERFGNNGVGHIGVEYWTKNSLILGLEGSFLFGSTVKQDVIAGLRTQEGFIIGNDRDVADIRLRQRGFYAGGLIGKLFPLLENNNRSGIRATLGLGLLQHKIRIQDDPQRDVAALSTEYKKGYDRLTNGLALNQFIGYQHLANDRLLNFSAGVEFIQGFTQNRRSFNFDTQMQDTQMRLDVLLALRVTWVLPFYLNETAGDIIY